MKQSELKMKIIKQPNNIKFGLGAAKDFRYPEKSLVITSKGASSRVTAYLLYNGSATYIL